MFPAVQSLESRIFAIQQQIDRCRSEMSVAKFRLLQSLQADMNSGTEYSFGMAPGGETSISDVSCVAEVLKLEAANVEKLESELRALLAAN